MDSLATFREEHAISNEVGGQGRYVRFEHGEVDFVASYFKGFDGKTKRLARTVAGQSGGYVIARKGWGVPVPPQLRPDDPVFTSNLRKPSYHPNHPSGPVFTDKGARVYPLPRAQREKHFAKHHADGSRPQGLHFHRRQAKYVLPPGAWGKRLDVPYPDRVLKADRVFFVIEGSLKTDAILSQGEAAFGVPSVTLWDTPELGVFIPMMRLRSKEVVIVPDADWCTNPLVIMQAMLCRTYLRDRGVNAIVAAPPLEDGQVIVHPVYGKLKGVDDFLRAGHSVDELSVLEREGPNQLEAWMAVRRHITRPDKLQRDVNALMRLPLYADADGQLLKCLSMFAKVLRCDRKTAKKAVIDLAHVGAIEVEGSLETAFKWTDPETGTKHDYDWDERPTITIASQFRAGETFVPLRDSQAVRASKEGMQLVESRVG